MCRNFIAGTFVDQRQKIFVSSQDTSLTTQANFSSLVRLTYCEQPVVTQKWDGANFQNFQLKSTDNNL